MEHPALFPEQASAMAGRVDLLFLELLGISTLMLLFLAALILGFAIKYRRGSSAARQARTREGLEWLWTGGLLVLFLLIFAWAARLYLVQMTPPSAGLEIYGVGKQWMWEFQHPAGQREINTLHLPLGSAVKLTLATQDVIHSFFVPAFRVKQDAVPGRYTTTWFTPARVGEYHLFCAEYCGLNHSRMGGTVVVMEPSSYEDWLNRSGAGESLAAQGVKLFRSYGCESCHGAGSPVLAPALAGIFGKPVPLQDGKVVTADEGYLRNSVLAPDQQIVAGYTPIMPSFAGRISESELVTLIAYLKSLSSEEPAR